MSFSSSSSTYAEFERLDCEQNKCKSAVYDNQQANFLEYRMLPDSRNRRCFRDTERESQLWTDQFKTRFYTSADCAQTSVVAAAEARQPCYTPVTGKTYFREMSKTKEPLEYSCRK